MTELSMCLACGGLLVAVAGILLGCALVCQQWRTT